MIGAQIAPFEGAVELLCTIPGVQRHTAENIIAEIGTDMTRFPSERHLASWAGQCPGNHLSAGKRHSGRTRKGSKNLNIALKDAGMAAIRTNDSYLQAQYRRLKPRMGHGRALGGQTLDHHRRLAHALHRRDLPKKPAGCRRRWGHTSDRPAISSSSSREGRG